MKNSKTHLFNLGGIKTKLGGRDGVSKDEVHHHIKEYLKKWNRNGTKKVR